MAYAPEGARAALDAWLAVRGVAPDSILAPISQTGIVRAGAGMTPHALMVRLKRRTKQAAIADPVRTKLSLHSGVDGNPGTGPANARHSRESGNPFRSANPET